MRASEAGHWYKADGSPCYEVPDKQGNLRPATLRDARKLGLYYSVTGIIRCAAAPGLETWKQNQVLMAALTLPRLPNEPDESFCKRILHDSQEQARKARDRGTDIHAAVQGHFEGNPPSEEFWPHVKGVADLLAANCVTSGWVAEKSFAHPFGFGGKCDIHSREWVLDFKTKEFTPEEAPTLKTWDEHAMQLAAYRAGLEVHSARCGIVYISTSSPGLCRLLEIDEREIEQGWAMFTGLLHYCKAKTGHYPETFQRVAA